MRGFSIRLNFLFILAVPCQISDQLSGAKHREHEGAITARSKGSNSHPQITRITVDARRSASHLNNSARRQPGNAVPWADAGNGRTSADAAPRFLLVMLGRPHHNDRLPSRHPTIFIATRRRPSGRTTQPVQQPAQRPVQRPVQQPVQQPVQRPFQQPVQRPVQQPVQQPVQRPVSNIKSGVLLRLKGNSSMNEGLVQVLVNNKWGYICNDNQWGAQDAKVVCRQLGFTSTAAVSVWTSWLGAHESYIMSNVVCKGSESRIQDCVYRQSTACSSRRPARVYCALNSGCEAGWVSGNGFCYKLVKSGATFDGSDAECRSLDAYLVKIESQMENNFLSSMLMAERAEGTIWTSGHLTKSYNNNIVWTWLGASHALRFSKWFPGLHTKQHNRAVNNSCIAMSKALPGSNEASPEVDYYFWKPLPCTQVLPFVCKKVAQTNDCFRGNGKGYRGTAFATTRASLCQKWTESNRVNPTSYPDSGLGDHNYCRNPDGDERPWCWVDADQERFGYCSLSSCPGRRLSLSTRPTIVEEVPTIKVRLIDGQRTYKGRVEVWHEGGWGSICGNQWDIRDAEVVCRQLGYVGALRTITPPDFRIQDGMNFILDRVQCSGFENSLHECGHSPWGNHKCEPRNTAGAVCNSTRVCLAEKEIACLGDDGPQCVQLAKVCDKYPDCADNADEANCLHMEVSLVGGNRTNVTEGRVEITINNITGTVCDDKWDDWDAAVICRMMGHNTGVALAVTGAKFGKGKGAIWLDDVGCNGNEEDIQDCKFPHGWGEHDCSHNEDAGVICLESGRTFPPMITYKPVAADCGQRPIHQPYAKIVGGQFAAYGAYPWQARIYKRQYRNEYVHSCGGTVIGQNWILSAAHCFEHTFISDMRVRIGDHRSDAYESSEQDFFIEQVFPHPTYSNILSMLFSSARYDNDIALVKVRSIGPHSGILFNDYVQPVCLPSSSVEYTSGLICEVSGWGLDGRSTPSVLMSAIIPLMNFTECQNLYKHKLSRKMFCAGYRDGSADTCQGDSGGPLVCNINGTYNIMGITSWGMGCGIRDSPGVYTKVGEFSEWILHTVSLHP